MLAFAPSASVASSDGAAAPRWSPPFYRPLEVSEHFRAPEHRYGAGHRGIDVPAWQGEDVLSPAAGTVTFAGTVVDRPLVTVRVGADTFVSIEPVRGTVSVGDRVTRGQRLGAVAAGGHCDATCVHLGVRVGEDRETRGYANPLRYFLEKPVLLPWGDG